MPAVAITPRQRESEPAALDVTKMSDVLRGPSLSSTASAGWLALRERKTMNRVKFSG